MYQDEIHRAGRFVEIGRPRFRNARRAESKPPHYLPNTAEFKIEITSGYPQDAERR
jgi:hypothetical protein